MGAFIHIWLKSMTAKRFLENSQPGQDFLLRSWRLNVALGDDDFRYLRWQTDLPRPGLSDRDVLR